MSEDLTASFYYFFLYFSLTFSLMAVFKSWELSGPYKEGGSYQQSWLVEAQHFLDLESVGQLAKKFIRFCTTKDSLKICQCFFPIPIHHKDLHYPFLVTANLPFPLSPKLFLKSPRKGALSRSKPPAGIRRSNVYVWLHCYWRLYVLDLSFCCHVSTASIQLIFD